MHSTSFLYFLLNALIAQRVIGNPIQLDSRGLQVVDVQPSSDEDTDETKRSVVARNGGLTVVDVAPQVDPGDDASKRSLEARKYPYKTDHCGVNGGKFMPLVAVNPAENGVNDAINSFCNHFDGTVIPGHSAVSALVQSSGGETLRLTDGSIGHFQGTFSKSECFRGYLPSQYVAAVKDNFCY